MTDLLRDQIAVLERLKNRLDSDLNNIEMLNAAAPRELIGHAYSSIKHDIDVLDALIARLSAEASI